MAKDIERKLIRILANFSTLHHRMPSIREIEIKTGRSRDGVYEVLAELTKKGFLEWSKNDPERIILLNEEYDPKPRTSGIWNAYGSN
ncbi:hypothetical protein ACFQ88_24360 [Paenibacillus sp. NPDC056579]|uniref:hypothetical protein n=1 Tax=Paenibacillus sp. NPDC056579 TaxID=3345871 RepID=UPI0036CBFF1F